MSRILAVCLAGLALCACGESYETVLAERRAGVLSQLQKIEAAGRSSLHYLDEIKDIQLPEGEKLRFSEEANAAIVQAEMFETQEERRTPRLDLGLHADWYIESRKALDGSSARLSGRELTAAFDTVESVRYLVVVRTRLMASPSAAGDRAFSPGLWQGEVMVYDISSGNFLGGAPLTVSNSDEIQVNTERAEQHLLSDLRSNTLSAVAQALSTCVEGSVFSE